MTAREQIETMVRGRCERDRKDSFGCSRGSKRRSGLALSGNMTRQRDCGTRLSLNPMPDQPRQKPPPREGHGRDH
jgi:hypothetical protein